MLRRAFLALSLAAWLPLGTPLSAQTKSRSDRYLVVLEAPPLAAANDIHKASQLRAAQDVARTAIEREGARVFGASRLLVNAVYAAATEEQAEQLRRLPGVSRVVPSRRIRRQSNRALELVNAPAAWDIVGGMDRAGQGVRIGILDSGIDHNHASFRNSGLSFPPGFPKCSGGDCAFTNTKVIAARSYVDMLAAGDDPEISRPDDTSPRDRVGHGTAAAMMAAGRPAQGPVPGPAGLVRGVAPGAWLGNYKIFGSPGLNDYTFDDVIITALEDAVSDGMDIVSLSFGAPALWGANDRGSTCSVPNNEPCDLLVDAVEQATRLGLTVVTVAGNDGDLGLKLPTLNSIHSPGIAPSAITVAASTNGQAYFAGVLVDGNDVPANDRRVPALFGDGPKPAQPLRGPLLDVARLDNDGRACSPLANGTLTGAIALIERGDCGFAIKVNYAQRAGAIGVILFQRQGNSVFPISGLQETAIPAVIIGNAAAQSLKLLLQRQPGRTVALDPSLQSQDATSNQVAYFSSQGPSTGENFLKPDVTAVGTNLYMATQTFDPNGDMYHPSGFTVAQGTSFAAPMVAGAAAILKQRNPRLRPGQIKSLIVNTADDILDDFDYDDRLVEARWTGGGAGLMNVRDAVRANVTVEPASVSFGVLASSPFPARTLTFTNLSNASVSLTLSAARREPDSNLTIQLQPGSISIPAGGTREVVVRLGGLRATPGSYEGEIRVTGSAVGLRIPFLYLQGDGVPFNAFPLRGLDFTGVVNERLPGRLTFKVVDRFGIPVANTAVRWGSTLGGGQIDRPMDRTDELGIAESRAILGPRLGEQEFSAEAGGLTLYFPGRSRLRPLIETGGVVNAASLRPGDRAAPGSYISIFGRGLSDVRREFFTPYLPVSLAGVSVSFDVPERRISVPGRIVYVSDELVNVQVPWELRGQTNARMKVSLGDFSTAIYNVPLADIAPAAFEYQEAGTGRVLAAARDAAFQLIGGSNPARRGQPIQIYANALGPVNNTPPSGEPTPADPLPLLAATVEVTIGGRPARVLFSGMTPQAIGLYQLNVEVPADTPSGIQPVQITVNGITAKPTAIPVQ